MPKVIQDLSLLKKLEPYITQDTEYICCVDWEDNYEYSWHTTRIVKSDTENIEIYNWWDKCQSWTDFYKTLTTEEAIELLPKYIDNQKLMFEAMWSWWVIRYLTYSIDVANLNKEAWKTLLEAIEKMLNYLINNNLMEELVEETLITK